MAISGDMGCELVQMSDQRFTKKVFNGDISHGDPWAKELKSLFYLNDLSLIFLSRLLCDIQDIRSVDVWYKQK